MTAPPTLYVPAETTDRQLVEILERVLPQYIDKVLTPGQKAAIKADPSIMNDIVAALAREMVSWSQVCGESQHIYDVSGKLMLNRPSSAECEAFGEFADRIIKVRYRRPDAQRPSAAYQAIKNAAGHAWAFIIERTIGHKPYNPTDGSVAGPRG